MLQARRRAGQKKAAQNGTEWARGGEMEGGVQELLQKHSRRMAFSGNFMIQVTIIRHLFLSLATHLHFRQLVMLVESRKKVSVYIITH